MTALGNCMTAAWLVGISLMLIVTAFGLLYTGGRR